MRSYMIGYDLNRPRKADDYPELIQAIKSIGTKWWHYLDSTWIVITEKTAVEVRNTLSPLIDSGDELLVAHLSGEAAWKGFSKQGSDWLIENLGH